MDTSPLSAISVLCADAHANSRAWLGKVLGSYRVTFAPTGFEALRQMNARSFHAFVLDYWLPDLPGTSLCREIRKLDPHAPVVFYSSCTREQERQRALRAGATAYVCRPYEQDVLEATLRASLGVADVKSLAARVAEEGAAQDELARRTADVLERSAAASALATASIERTARTKAYRAYINAQGSRARFDAWWPNVFQSVSANHRRRPVNAARAVSHTPAALTLMMQNERDAGAAEIAGGSERAEAWRTRVVIDNRDKLRFWCRELGRTASELRAAVKAVGSDLEKVREHLGRGAGCR